MLAKQLADLITLLRSTLLLFFPWLAITYGQRGLTWAGAFLALNWTGDILDGSLARRSRLAARSWIGDHDLEVDMSVSLGLLLYLLINRYVQLIVAVVYLGIWAIYFLRKGLPRSMGMLFQAPVYGWFIYTALLYAPNMGWGLVGWVLAALVITWPRFPAEVIPNFLAGVRAAFHLD